MSCTWIEWEPLVDLTFPSNSTPNKLLIFLLAINHKREIELRFFLSLHRSSDVGCTSCVLVGGVWCCGLIVVLWVECGAVGGVLCSGWSIVHCGII